MGGISHRSGYEGLGGELAATTGASSAPAGESVQDLSELAVDLLIRLSPRAGLARAEAWQVMQFMKPLQVVAGTRLFQEGDDHSNDYMVLVLEGYLRVESDAVVGEDVVISVVEPGQIVGEMGVIDGGPRSASCVALTDAKLAVLSRPALVQLVASAPVAAAHFALSLAHHITLRLRLANGRLRANSQLLRALRSELDAAHAINRKLLDQPTG